MGTVFCRVAAPMSRVDLVANANAGLRPGDGLVVASITTTPDVHAAVPAEYAFLAELLDGVYAEHPELRPPARPATADATWIAYRLAELLPLGIRAALDILELDLPTLKLARVAAFIADQGNSGNESTSH